MKKMCLPRFVTKGLFCIMMVLLPLTVHATVGWNIGDMVLDFGVDLEGGEQAILIDSSEVGHPFFVELTWKLNSDACLLQVQESTEKGHAGTTKIAQDDSLFDGVVSHARYENIEAVVVTAADGQYCEIDPSHDEFLVIAREPRAPVSAEGGLLSAPLGAVVVVFRAPTFFVPSEVIINQGEKVVWVYADGAQEPHSVTSGTCRVNDCSGGGQVFNSGLTVNKPGQRFEHVFKEAGTFPYHCDLHLGSMQGTVVVQDSN